MNFFPSFYVFPDIYTSSVGRYNPKAIEKARKANKKNKRNRK